jgi:acyl-CoA synthetase (AMP-forming)/AMP-acid ligase II
MRSASTIPSWHLDISNYTKKCWNVPFLLNKAKGLHHPGRLLCQKTGHTGQLLIMKPTSTTSSIPFRPGNFSTLTEALDYAAHGDTGYNFYNGAGKLQIVLPYAELSKQAQITARCLSWLPYYHDMGLVGLVVAPMAAQISVDFLNTRDFAMRPRLFTAALTIFS